MEEQSTWKGHTFTLLVFGGIVVLCSIFFTLGMLVGRTQGQKIAATAAVDAAAKSAQKVPAREEQPEMSFYDSAQKKQPAAAMPTPAQAKAPTPAPVPVKPAPATAPPPVAAAESPVTPTANVVNLQIGAFATSAKAEQVMDAAKKQGFNAFMLTPASSDARPVYRVQVGPIRDAIEQESMRQKLVALGYTVLVAH